MRWYNRWAPLWNISLDSSGRSGLHKFKRYLVGVKSEFRLPMSASDLDRKFPGLGGRGLMVLFLGGGGGGLGALATHQRISNLLSPDSSFISLISLPLCVSLSLLFCFSYSFGS